MSQIPEQLYWIRDREWQEVQEGLFIVKHSEKTGYVPFTFGVVVKVYDPRYETFFYVGSGPVFVASGGYERMFDCVFDKGKHTVWIITRTNPKNSKTPNERKWRRISIEVEGIPRDPSKMGIISNFFQTKAAGQYVPGSTGLDVSFTISTSTPRENPETLEWDFDVCHPSKDPAKPSRLIIKWPMARDHYSEDYTYKENGLHTGYVKITYSNGNPAGECKVSVVIGDNKKP